MFALLSSRIIFSPCRLAVAVRAVVAGATLVVAPVSAIHAAETAAQVEVSKYSLPAGPLAERLAEFAAVAGVQIFFDGQSLAGLRSEKLEGSYTVEAGFAQLLRGSGYELAKRGSEGYSLRAAIDDKATLLRRVDVKSAHIVESGYGPVRGYVARKSITATRADIALIETPQSVSVVTADQIRIQAAETLAQTLKYSSGVAPLGSTEAFGEGLIIRGFNVTGTFPVYLNGSKLSRNVYSGVSEPYSLERLEVLKGPASVLYGNAAPGGIINMVKKLPQLAPAGEINVQAGSFDRKQVSGDVTGALTADGEWSYRVTGLLRRSDTMIDHVEDDRNFGSASVRWQPSDATSLTLFVDYQDIDTAESYGLPPQGTVQPGPRGRIDRDRFVGEPGFNEIDTKSHTVGYLFSHDFNDQMTFRQNVLYYDGEVGYADTWFFGSAYNAQTGRLARRTAVQRDDEDKSWSIDNQFEHKIVGDNYDHKFLVGVDYSDYTFNRSEYRGPIAGLDLYNPVYGTPINIPLDSKFTEEYRQAGIYVQEHLKLLDHWVVMLGGRYDQAEAESKDRLAGTPSEDMYDDDAFSGRAGLVYLFDNGIAPYISYSESFQPISGRDVNDSAFEPTEGKQYEAGVRYAPADQNLSITASVYKLTQTNVSTSDLQNPGFSVQEGEVESKGFELEARANLTNNLNLIASYGYIDNAVTKSNTNTEGNRFGAVARNQASVWTDYHFQEALKGLVVGGGVRYFGESLNLANTYKVPSYTVVDMAVNYSLTPNWDLALNINNLLDEEYATCTYMCFYGEERAFKVGATYRW